MTEYYSVMYFRSRAIFCHVLEILSLLCTLIQISFNNLSFTSENVLYFSIYAIVGTICAVFCGLLDFVLEL